MTVHSWSPDVEIETGLGQYHTIHTAEDAARQLVGPWPFRSKAFQRVNQACLDLVEGKTTANTARRATYPLHDAESRHCHAALTTDTRLTSFLAKNVTTPGNLSSGHVTR